MNPQPRPPSSRRCLQAQAIVDIDGVVIVDREQVQVGQVAPVLITGLGAVGLQEQMLGLGFKVSAEALLPGGGFE